MIPRSCGAPRLPFPRPSRSQLPSPHGTHGLTTKFWPTPKKSFSFFFPDPTKKDRRNFDSFPPPMTITALAVVVSYLATSGGGGQCPGKESGVACGKHFLQHACRHGTRLEDGCPKHMFIATRAPWAAGGGGGAAGPRQPAPVACLTDLSDRFCYQNDSRASAPEQGLPAGCVCAEPSVQPSEAGN